MKKKWAYISITIVCIIVSVIMVLGLNGVIYLVNNGMFSGISLRYNDIHQSPSIDFIGNLISGYSMFITVVLFVLGVPIALFSYSSRKEIDKFEEKFEAKFEVIEKEYDKFREKFETKSESIKKDNHTFRADSKKEFDTTIKSVMSIQESLKKDMEREMKENKAYDGVEKAYDDDPECLKKPEGKMSLGEFSKSFVEKQTREAKRYFFAGVSYSQGKVKNVNDVESGQDLYTDDQLKELNIASEYFTMCEKKLPYSDEDKDEIFRSSLYNEKAIILKYLGLHYYYHNSILAMDYLLAALEYFQKAVQSDDRDVLPFNSKSNILKDIYRLITGKENTKIRELLLEKFRQKLVSMSLSVFDIKSINKFIKTILLVDRIHFQNTNHFEDLRTATEHCKKYKCFECKYLCHDCTILFKDINSDLLLAMVLLESIICVQNEVLNPESIYKFNRTDTSEKSNKKYNEQHKYWCYLTCAISYYLMFNYSLGSKDSLDKEVEGNYWYESFLDNLSSAIKEGINLGGGMTIDRFIFNHIKQDKDLESYRNIPNWEDQLREKVKGEVIGK